MNEMLRKLESAIISGKAMHAFLLSGADPETTDSVSRELAAMILYGSRDSSRLSDDPDCMEYSGSVSIGEFRDVIRPEIYRETYKKSGRVVIFRNAGMLSPIVQNAMLKVLEEPPLNTSFILTGSEYGLLSTIRSRCMILRCSSPDLAEIKEELEKCGADPASAERFARMSGGSIGRAKRLYSSEDARALRDSAVTAFLAALNAAPDFGWTKAKRERGDHIEANELLLLACHDMMMLKSGLGPDHFPDWEDKLKNTASLFTYGEIGCIIKRLTENAERLSTNTPGGASFDRLFASLAETGLTKKKKV